MKNRKNKHIGLGSILAAALLMAGCGAAQSGASYKSATMEAAAEDMAADTGAYNNSDIYMSEAAEMAEEAPAEGGGAQTPRVQESDRKLIRNVTLNVETETFDELMRTIVEKTDSFGGYVEESNSYNGSRYYGGGTRNASLTLRIPAQKLDEFLGTVSEISNVVNQSESVTDVTLQYVDMESHKQALVTEQKRLLELLEQAESVEDIITIESRLSDVRYQIESMEAQLRTMDNQVSYSTVYLYIDEVARLTPVKEQTAFEKIRTGFVGSLYDIGEGSKNLLIGFVINLPYFVLWAVIIGIGVLLYKFVLKPAIRKRTEKREQKKDEKTADNAVNKTVEKKEKKNE
jgi:hypothetical protein